MKILSLLFASLMLPLSLIAENSTTIGAYSIHHNAITTDILTPEVASTYQIQRSKNRAMINIAILKQDAEGTQHPVAARVTLQARNLVGHIRDLNLREIREGKAIYYIADFPVADREHLQFTTSVIPTGESYPIKANFQQQFYTR
jgi:hypothetical protein